jgi:hypothetical protein
VDSRVGDSSRVGDVVRIPLGAIMFSCSKEDRRNRIPGKQRYHVENQLFRIWKYIFCLSYLLCTDTTLSLAVGTGLDLTGRSSLVKFQLSAFMILKKDGLTEVKGNGTAIS